MKECLYCQVMPRKLVVDRSVATDNNEKISIFSYVCGDRLYTGTCIDKFAENFMRADDICNENGDLEYEESEKIEFCPKCGRKLNK